MVLLASGAAAAEYGRCCARSLVFSIRYHRACGRTVIRAGEFSAQTRSADCAPRPLFSPLYTYAKRLSCNPTSLVVSCRKNKQVGAVVVGLDTSFGFRQMCVASSYIQQGALFLGTNPDVADRVGSLLMPGTGPILASIQTASGVRLSMPENCRSQGAPEESTRACISLSVRLFTSLLCDGRPQLTASVQ